jgi:long-chain fatty acid transport protein
MRRHRSFLPTMALTALLIPAAAGATGYAIYEQGAAALGMAGANTASVKDASAVFFNPAALARLEGTRIYVGGSALAPITSVTGTATGAGAKPADGVTEEMVKQVFFPPTIYATHRLSKGLGFGIGVNSPYGLGVEWDADEFSGRYITTKVDLQTLNGSACLAWAPNEQWSFAGGADALFTKVLLRKRQLLTNPTFGLTDVDIVSTEMTSDFTPGYGWNAAVLYTPAARWRVGAFYRSKVVIHVDDAEADFTQIMTGIAPVDAYVATLVPPDQTAGTVLRFPAIWSAGVAFDPEPDWTVEADFVWYEWSVFADLPFYFETTPQLNTTRIEDYKDSWQVRLGAEHRRGDLAYRFGYYYDRSPAPTYAVSPLLPDADRIGVSVGLGWAFGPDKDWTLDGYGLGLFLDRRYGYTEDSYADFQGDYKTFTGMLGLGLGYRF